METEQIDVRYLEYDKDGVVKQAHGASAYRIGEHFATLGRNPRMVTQRITRDVATGEVSAEIIKIEPIAAAK